jgi:hypothetical protein
LRIAEEPLDLRGAHRQNEDRKMSKRDKNQTHSGSQSRRTPPVFFPVVVGVPQDFQFTDAQIAQLEREGEINFSEQQRKELETLAQFWIDDLRLRRTARPKQFYECLDKTAKTLSQAKEACQWNERVGSLERHLLHWAMETSAPGAVELPGNLAVLEQQIKVVLETVDALKQCLPEDPGRQRPFDDQRRMIFLADIFERAGGKAAVYWSEATTSSYADTPFRKFAHQFYSLLSAEDKRDPGGLDDALRDALSARRAQQRATS